MLDILKLINPKLSRFTFSSFCMLMLFSICSCSTNLRLRVENIVIVENQLYALTSDNSIRIIDIKSNKLNKKIVDTDMLIAIRGDKDSVLLHGARTGIRMIDGKGNISPVINESDDYWAVNTSGIFKLVGADDDAIYCITRSIFDDNKKRQFRGYSYNKINKKILKDHFKDYPELLLLEIFEDTDLTWYICINGSEIVENFSIPLHGKLTLLSKSKSNSSIRKFDLNIDVGGDVTAANRSDRLFIFLRDYSKHYSKDTIVYTFNKISTAFRYEETIAYRVDAVPDQNISDADRFVWVYNRDRYDYELIKMDINTFQLFPFKVKEIFGTGNYRSVSYFPPLTYDKTGIWKGFQLFNGGNRVNEAQPIPYVIKISRDGTEYQMLHVKPSFKEAITESYRSFYFDTIGRKISHLKQ